MFQSLKRCWQTAPPLRHSRSLSTKGIFIFGISLRVDSFLLKYVVSFCIHVDLTPSSLKMPYVFLYCLQCSLLLTWETHEAGHRLADGQLSSPCPPSSSFCSFGTASVMSCCFPPASLSTPYGHLRTTFSRKPYSLIWSRSHEYR